MKPLKQHFQNIAFFIIEIRKKYFRHLLNIDNIFFICYSDTEI